MRKVFLVGMLGVVLAAAPVFAQEALAPASGNVGNLETGFPTKVADTTTTDEGMVQVGVAGSYLTNGTVWEEALVQVNYGLLPNVQLTADWGWVIGEGWVRGNGDTSLGVLWRAIDEQDSMPSMGLQLSAILPTGDGFTGYSGVIVGGLTKTYGQARFHLNAGYVTVGDDGAGVLPVRNDMDLVTLGMDYTLLDTLVLVVDAYSWEAPLEGGNRLEAVEVGMRAALTEIDTLSVGVSMSIGNGNMTPDFTATVGYQRAL